MISYRVVLSNKAKRQLKKMDRNTMVMLSKKINKQINGIEDPRSIGKALQGDLDKLWSYRVGQYRLLCEIDDSKILILILQVGHRKDIYDKG